VRKLVIKKVVAEKKELRKLKNSKTNTAKISAVKPPKTSKDFLKLAAKDVKKVKSALKAASKLHLREKKTVK
jgi:hypothetical protein